MSKNHSLRLGARIWKIELGAFLKICESVSTPRSQACYMLALAGEWGQYLELTTPDFDSVHFADDYLVTECMRKNPRLPGLAIDRKAVAKTKWLEAEAQCRTTNELLRLYREGKISFPPSIETVITKAQSWIANVLNDFDSDQDLSLQQLQFIESKFRFGPGATSSCSGRNVVLSRKMVSRFDVTPGLYPYYRALLGPRWSEDVNEVSLRHFSTIQFVPKDAKTDRPIGIEPHANIFVQLGIGAGIRRQLQRHGINLDTLPDENRRRAGIAHRDGLATIDLSSASDTIALELVHLLLPPRWAYLLDLARTGWSKIDGRLVELQKFSAMGNGYTFELESLIFTALARACGDSEACSFGDDIITTQANAKNLVATLNLFGFSVNKRKTFLAGRFFESCGADYHDGQNVRPFYFRGEYYDETSAVIRIANRIREYAHRRNLGYGCDCRFLPAWLYSVHRDKRARKTAVPIGFGDDGLIRNFDEATPSKARYGIEGYVSRVWRVKPKISVRTDIRGAYLSALAWGTPGDYTLRVGGIPPSRRREMARGRFSGAAFGRQLVPSWPEPGPWC